MEIIELSDEQIDLIHKRAKMLKVVYHAESSPDPVDGVIMDISKALRAMKD